MYRTHTIPLGTGGAILQIQTYIPTCVTPEYWQRHTLSRHDIETIVSYVPTLFLWLVALTHGLHCPWYSLRTSAASTLDVTMSGKATAIELLLTTLGIQPSSTNRLDLHSVESFEHVPPVPRHTIPTADFLRLTHNLVGPLLPRCLLLDTDLIPQIPFIWSYRGLPLVAVGLEGDVVCCHVVVPEANYVYNPQGYTHAPLVGLFEGVVYCLTDEVLLLGVE